MTSTVTVTSSVLCPTDRVTASPPGSRLTTNDSSNVHPVIDVNARCDGVRKRIHGNESISARRVGEHKRRTSKKSGDMRASRPPHAIGDVEMSRRVRRTNDWTTRDAAARERRRRRIAPTRATASRTVTNVKGDEFMDLASTSSTSGSETKRVTLRDVIRGGDGPARMFSPLRGRGRRRERRDGDRDSSARALFVYLPGLDGTGFSASSQFDSIARAGFDIAALNVPAGDRSDAFALVDVVIAYLDAEKRLGETEVYLMGESMGGMLALCVAATRPDLIKRLILVNPASSFDRSVWPTLGPALPSIPGELWGALPYAIAPVLIDPVRMARGMVDKLLETPTEDPVGTLAAATQELAGLLPALGALSEIIPRDTLRHRLEILRQGCEFLNSNDYARLTTMNVPTLVVASEKDNLIPSLAESARLKAFLPNCKVEVLKDASHAALQEPGVDLMEICRRNGVLPRTEDELAMTRDVKFDPPSRADLERARESLAGLRALTSPVFFSTRPDGKIVRGLDAVPMRQRGSRPILLVGNHQTMAPDLGFLVDEFIREKNVCIRGLAHPVVARGGGGFGDGDEDGSPQSLDDMLRGALKGTPLEAVLPRREPKPPRNNRAMAMGGLGTFTSFGAVPVSGMNFFRLMKQGEAVLLFPGGVREAFKRKNEMYELFWPTKPEFVRMAAKFDAIIVPFAAVGAEDSFDIVQDADDLLKNPIFGESVRERANKMPKARASDAFRDDEELFIQPVVVPKVPERFYFRFMAPIDLSDVDLDNEASVKAVYDDVKSEVANGIEYLRAKRASDPFKDLGPRLLYESATSSQAPTFVP